MGLKIGRPIEPVIDREPPVLDRGAVPVPTPPPERPAFLRSQALELLESDLRRYCNDEIQGQSFLIAGHRGAGKTTLVHRAIETINKCTDGGTFPMRPLPVFLHGPSLFSPWPSDLDTAALRDYSRKAAAKSVAASVTAENVTGRTLPSSDGAPPTPTTDTVDAGALPSATSDAPGAPSKAEELQAQVALTQIVLSLHRSVAREFGKRYRAKVLSRQGLDRPEDESTDGELAAQFELELQEDPPAARLRQFWDLIDAVDEGVLFDKGHGATSSSVGVRPCRDQGSRELVALNGICNAHQRISGVLSGQQAETLTSSHTAEVTRSTDFKTVDAIKPATAVFSGSLVAAGTAVGGQGLLTPLLLGLATTWAASMLFKSTTTTKAQRARKVDRTFLPDLSVRTLDRVIPVLIHRLRAAGLAPVFIIDELDKHKRLCEAMRDMIPFMKKLFAESVFTCFLTDRGYMESLRWSARKSAYDKTSSYFSQRLLVAYEAGDFRDYLANVLINEGDTSAEQTHREIVGWVLRHRSRLHALELCRELNRWRGVDGDCTQDSEQLKSSRAFKCDATLQVVVECRLAAPAVVSWLRQHPDLRQVMYDALYYISRQWLSGAPHIDLNDTSPIRNDLFKRMNLEEARPVDEEDEDKPTEDTMLAPTVFSFLLEQIREMAVQLSSRKINLGSPAIASDGVRDFLLMEPFRNFLLSSPDSPDDLFLFEYFPSGDLVRPDDSVTKERATAELAYLRNVHAALEILMTDIERIKA